MVRHFLYPFLKQYSICSPTLHNIGLIRVHLVYQILLVYMSIVFVGAVVIHNFHYCSLQTPVGKSSSIASASRNFFFGTLSSAIAVDIHFGDHFPRFFLFGVMNSIPKNVTLPLLLLLLHLLNLCHFIFLSLLCVTTYFICT